MAKKYQIIENLDNLFSEEITAEGNTHLDYARKALLPRAPRPARRYSALNVQIKAWNKIMGQLVRWGINPVTLRNEQAQVIKQGNKLVTKSIQPDIQAADPQTGRRINIEVEVAPSDRTITSKQERVRKKIIALRRNDPTARIITLIIDLSGKPVEKRVSVPKKSIAITRGENIRKKDVLDQARTRISRFEDYGLDYLIEEGIHQALTEKSFDYLDVPCVYGRWCGPGCSGPGLPVDPIDKCCKAHDRCYEKRGYFACSCDRDLVKCLAPHSAFSRPAKVMRTYFKYSPCKPWA